MHKSHSRIRCISINRENSHGLIIHMATVNLKNWYRGKWNCPIRQCKKGAKGSAVRSWAMFCVCSWKAFPCSFICKHNEDQMTAASHTCTSWMVSRYQAKWQRYSRKDGYIQPLQKNSRRTQRKNAKSHGARTPCQWKSYPSEVH